jgi:hypothetical protein
MKANLIINILSVTFFLAYVIPLTHTFTTFPRRYSYYNRVNQPWKLCYAPGEDDRNQVNVNENQNSIESKELESKLRQGQYAEAYQLLKRNPMLYINEENAKILLNNLNKLGAPSYNDRQLMLKQAIFSIFSCPNLTNAYLLYLFLGG